MQVHKILCKTTWCLISPLFIAFKRLYLNSTHSSRPLFLAEIAVSHVKFLSQNLLSTMYTIQTRMADAIPRGKLPHNDCLVNDYLSISLVKSLDIGWVTNSLALRTFRAKKMSFPVAPWCEEKAWKMLGENALEPFWLGANDGPQMYLRQVHTSEQNICLFVSLAMVDDFFVDTQLAKRISNICQAKSLIKRQ